MSDFGGAREALAGAWRTLRVVSSMGGITADVLATSLRHTHVERASIDAHARDFAATVIRELDIDLHVWGKSNVEDVSGQQTSGQSCVFVSNHQSHLDIPIIYAALPPMTLRMVAKRELFAIPIWGRALAAAGYIEIDRSNRARAIASIERAAALMRDGVHIWMAPEGSRSRDGRIGALKKGAFHLAKDTGARIIPMAIDGTRHILPRGGVAMKRGQTVRVTIGAPLAPPTDATMAHVMDEVRAFFVAHVPPHQAA